MTTTASKLFFGASIVALLTAWAYGWGTGGGFTGVMLVGLKGGVGGGRRDPHDRRGRALRPRLRDVDLRDADPEQQAPSPASTPPPVTAPSAGVLADGRRPVGGGRPGRAGGLAGAVRHRNGWRR